MAATNAARFRTIPQWPDPKLLAANPNDWYLRADKTLPGTAEADDAQLATTQYAAWQWRPADLLVQYWRGALGKHA